MAKSGKNQLPWLLGSRRAGFTKIVNHCREPDRNFLRILLHERSRHHNVEWVGRRQNGNKKRTDAVTIP